MPKAKLTTKGAIDALTLPDGKLQEHWWCTDLRGFGVVVGKLNKTFVVQRDVKGRSRRVSIGRYGEITVHEARRRAEEVMGEMRAGVDPLAQRRAAAANNMTLEEAWKLYKEGHLEAKERSPRTVSDYEANLNRYLSDWLKRPLVEITRTAAHARHRKISKENGKAAANHAMVTLRAIWRRVRKQYPALDAPPTENVDFNKTHPRTAVIPYDKLPEWWEGVQKIENPIRRDLYIWLLFTGTRSEEARSMRWDQVDLKAGTVDFPVTKTEPFTLPLSNFLVKLLKERRACKTTAALFKDSEFVFPAKSKTGYVAEAKLNGKKEADLFPCRWTPHTLRHTFITLAENKVGIHPKHIRLLVNHVASGNGDAHADYNHPELSDLKRSQQAITDVLRKATMRKQKAK